MSPKFKKRAATPPNVTQDDWDDETPETVPTNFDGEEEENPPKLPQRSPIILINVSIKEFMKN